MTSSFPQTPPFKVLLDTDIGTDVDDIYALALTLASPEINLVGVTVVLGDVDLRARLALAAIRAAGRDDAPVAVGASHPMQPMSEAPAHPDEGHGLDLSDLDMSGLSPLDAQALLLQTCARHQNELVLVTIGPMTNAGLFARNHPHAFASLAGLSVMGGNYAGVNARTLTTEYNFACDPEAVDHSLKAGIPVRLVGLNVTTRTCLSRDHLCELADIGTPAARLLYQSGLHYMNMLSRERTPMHDSLAIAAMLRPDLFTWRRLRPRVQTMGAEAGAITFHDDIRKDQPVAEVAVDLDVPGFQDWFWERIRAFAHTSSSGDALRGGSADTP